MSASFLRQAEARRKLTENKRKQLDDERNFQRYLEAVQAAAEQLALARYSAMLERDTSSWELLSRARELLDSCSPELRSAEWYCLDNLLQNGPAPANSRLRLRIAAGDFGRGPPALGGGVLSPDGRFRFWQGRVYDTASGRPLFGSEPEDDAGIIFLGFSKGGERFFQRLGNRVIIRQTSTGRRIVTLGWWFPGNGDVFLVDGEKLAWGHGNDWFTINVTTARE
jgi:hypothetical protein